MCSLTSSVATYVELTRAALVDDEVLAWMQDALPLTVADAAPIVIHCTSTRETSPSPSASAPDGHGAVLHSHTEVFMASTGHGRDRAHQGPDPREDPPRDRWWLSPLITFVVFRAFVVYATIRAFMGARLLRRRRTSRRSTRPASATASRAPRDFGQPFQLVAALAGADHPDLPAGLPDDLLLLPQGLLPGVLALAAGLRRRRAAREVHRRDPLPADPPERPPLLLVRRRGGGLRPHLRRRCWPSATRTTSGATWASARS